MAMNEVRHDPTVPADERRTRGCAQPQPHPATAVAIRSRAASAGSGIWLGVWSARTEKASSRPSASTATPASELTLRSVPVLARTTPAAGAVPLATYRLFSVPDQPA